MLRSDMGHSKRMLREIFPRRHINIRATQTTRVAFFGSILFVAGLLTIFHVALAMRTHSEDAVRSLHRTPFVVALDSGITSEQKQMFLQALLSLPHIHTVNARSSIEPSAGGSVDSATDQVEISLRSLADFDTVFSFLQRPELRDILVPSALSLLPALRVATEDRMMYANRTADFASFIAFGTLLLTPLFLLFHIARRQCVNESRLLQLFGAGMRTALVPCMREGARILLPAWICAIIGAGVAMIALGMALPTATDFFIAIIAEAVLFCALLILVAASTLHPLFRTSAI